MHVPSIVQKLDMVLVPTSGGQFYRSPGGVWVSVDNWMETWEFVEGTARESIENMYQKRLLQSEVPSNVG